MCRNIRILFNFDPPATEEEVYNASLQFVRKISGIRKPSKINEEAFNAAVKKISLDVRNLIKSLETKSVSLNREEEKRKAKERNLKRFGKI